MNILKSLGEFLVTGIVFIISYVLYFVIGVMLTFILGLPIAFGIKMIIDFISIILTNTKALNY
jgi:hypothetical protein